jgi:hypothetical protein
MISMFLNALLPLSFPVQAEATEYPFKLTIALEKTTFKVEEPVNITWVLTNIGQENVTLYNSRDFPLDFLVRDQGFTNVFRYRSYVGVLQVIYPFAPIMPSDNMTMADVWKQIYDDRFLKLPDPYNGVGHFWSPKKVFPGTYYVSGIFHSATYGVNIETPVMRITIQ